MSVPRVDSIAVVPSWIRLPTAICLVILSLGCSGPRDLAARVPPPTGSAESAAHGRRILGRLKGDQPAQEERGRRRFQGRSTIGSAELREPTDVAFLRVLVRDLVASGFASAATLDQEDPDLILDVTLLRLYGSYTEGVETLPLVIPTSSVEARCQVLFQLRDGWGRTFLEKELNSEDRGVAAAVGGLSSAALNSLTRCIRDVMDELISELGRADLSKPTSAG